MAEQELHGVANLVLLCPTHHAIVDSEPNSWTEENLRHAKSDHEVWVRAQLSKGFLWYANLSTIHYLNVPRLLFNFAAEGIFFEHLDGELWNKRDLRNMGLGLARLLLQFEQVLKEWRPGALDLEKFTTLSPENVGARIRFEGTFRTKNVPGPSQACGDTFSLSGDFLKDPHIYKIYRGHKVYMPIDPRWITTATAFCDFCPPGGINQFAGLGLLKLMAAEYAVVSPLVIGLASPRGSGFAYSR